MEVADHTMTLFLNAFHARDLAEGLVSFDDKASVDSIRSTVQDRQLDVVGIRQGGVVVGWVSRNDLTSDHPFAFRPLVPTTVISDEASLNAVVEVLHGAECLFVKSFGEVNGIIARKDIQKIPFRMWLFGMVTIIEQRVTQLIASFCPQDSWKQCLSPRRLQMAISLQKARRRRGQSVSVLECLRLADKGKIVARHDELRNLTGFASRRTVEEFVSEFQDLRNNLAHSQDISGNWEVIYTLATELHRVVMGPEKESTTA